MISLLVLVASASCAPQYGPPPPLPSPTPTPEKLIAPVTPAIACTVSYVTVWDTEYHDHENEVNACLVVSDEKELQSNTYLCCRSV